MSARRLLVAFVGVLAVAVLIGVFALTPSGPRAEAAAPSQLLPGVSQGRCPKLKMQPLPGDAVAGAALAALDQARVVYRGFRLKGMRVTVSILARDDDSGRGGYARVKCGRRAQNRTVAVSLKFPAMRPSAGLSQGVVLVSRFAGEYRVWALLH